MPRLRHIDPSTEGWTLRRRGRGFELLDSDGRTISDPEARLRVKGLVIPPAWSGVWISPDPFGHIQATGTDDAGRLQYLYHPDWHERRSRQKFDEMTHFARRLPTVRERVGKDIEQEGLSQERVLAGVVRLLDTGFFRIGCETYARSNGSYGLATMLRDHVSLKGSCLIFDYPAKSGQRHVSHVIDPVAADLVRSLRRARHGTPGLFGWREGGAWRPLRSTDVNAYIKDAAKDPESSAKDFRTWKATVLAAIALAVSSEVADSPTRRKRAISRAVSEVATYLGNTPAVARRSYIDPRVTEAYEEGRTIARAVTRIDAGDEDSDTVLEPHVERAVLRLLAQ